MAFPKTWGGYSPPSPPTSYASAMLDHIRALVILGELKLMHDFVVVEGVVSPVILGVDFLQSNTLLLDFGKTPVQVSLSKQHTNELQSNATPPEALAMYEIHRKTRAKVCTVKEIEKPGDDVVEECAIPMFSEPPSIEFPQCQHPDFLRIVREYSNLFCTRPTRGHKGLSALYCY